MAWQQKQPIFFLWSCLFHRNLLKSQPLHRRYLMAQSVDSRGRCVGVEAEGWSTSRSQEGRPVQTHTNAWTQGQVCLKRRRQLKVSGFFILYTSLIWQWNQRPLLFSNDNIHQGEGQTKNQELQQQPEAKHVLSTLALSQVYKNGN